MSLHCALLLDYAPAPKESCHHPHQEGRWEGLPEMAGMNRDWEYQTTWSHGAPMIDDLHIILMIL